MKKLLITLLLLGFSGGLIAQSNMLVAGATKTVLKQKKSPAKKYETYLRPSGQKLENKQFVWYVVHKEDTVGEFWPVWNVNLITNQTDPHLFTRQMTMEMLHDSLKYGTAITPDGMTAGSMPLRMEGKALANGIPAGDGKVHNYGIVIAHTNRYGLSFTHKKEIPDFQNQYDKVKRNKGTLFFLPAIYNKGSMHPSTKSTVDRVLINRTTPKVSTDPLPGKQQGVIVFYQRHSYPKVMDIIFGLNRKHKDGSAKSRTKHVYALDGGGNYGAVIRKNLGGDIKVIGTRNRGVNSNYLVWY